MKIPFLVLLIICTSLWMSALVIAAVSISSPALGFFRVPAIIDGALAIVFTVMAVRKKQS